LQETQGKCTLGELADYVTKRVNQESVVANKRPQTPTVSVSPGMTDRWAKLTLR